MIETLEELRQKLTANEGDTSEETFNQVEEILAAFGKWSDEEVGGLFVYIGLHLLRRDPSGTGIFRTAARSLKYIAEAERLASRLKLLDKWLKHNVKRQ
jgi:hypothetical protein